MEQCYTALKLFGYDCAALLSVSPFLSLSFLAPFSPSSPIHFPSLLLQLFYEFEI